MGRVTHAGGVLLSRVARAGGGLGALGVVALALRWSVGYPVPIAHSLASAQPTFDHLLIGAVGLVAWALLGWATVVVTIEARSGASRRVRAAMQQSSRASSLPRRCVASRKAQSG